MFFIHGGGYAFGSSATPIYDGAAMVRRGCVYVSVNYRLGPLGCIDTSSLSTPESSTDSNLFLRDLVMALRWVCDNIAVFGGDPDNVTIFAESAGTHAVATLLAVLQAKGLFHPAISQSPASGVVRSHEAAAVFAEHFVEFLGARSQGGAAALMAAPPAELGDALEHLIRGGEAHRRRRPCQPLPAGMGGGDRRRRPHRHRMVEWNRNMPAPGRRAYVSASRHAANIRQFPQARGTLTGVLVLKSAALFVLAALLEIGGAWLVWQGVREHRGWIWAGAGVIALGAYGFVAAFQPDAHFGRILAAYGGVFVAGSLLWGVVVDGFRPDRWDVTGALVCLVGVGLIMYAPR